jgi:hypothetical protein
MHIGNDILPPLGSQTPNVQRLAYDTVPKSRLNLPPFFNESGSSAGRNRGSKMGKSIVIAAQAGSQTASHAQLRITSGNR